MKRSQIQEIGIGETRSEVEKYFGNPGLVLMEDFTTFHYFSDNSEATVAVRYVMAEGTPQATDKVVEVSQIRVSEQGKGLIDLLRNRE
jgi:outer membrane protein assembly factor BamE (lipoprotein component of BamABCDE complex)